MQEDIRTEIISVGTELLLGQIANTNAQWLSQQLASFGINTYHHTVVGDNVERLKNVFITAQNRSNIVIVTGGLGPTSDDLTREAFQQITHDELIEHEPSLKKIYDYYKKQSTSPTQNNQRQARIFQNAQVIPNDLGMAPGMIVHHQETVWVFLPGVPREMKQMSTHYVLPYLRKLSGEDTFIQSKILRLIGIGESLLEDQISDLIQKQTNPTMALLAQNDGVIIRLTAKAKTDEEANALISQTQREIEKVVGDYIYGYDNLTIEKAIAKRLQENNEKVAAAESLTGGLFIEKLISYEGASAITPGGLVCYDLWTKQNLLKVSENILTEKGMVSRECAFEMARGIAKLYGVDYGISFTGVAGPERLENEEVGTVWIGLFHKSGKYIVENVKFNGNRQTIRERAVLKGFELLLNFLNS